MKLQQDGSKSENVSDTNYALVADIGGSHITAALCDINKQELVRGTKSRIELRSKGSAEDILYMWTHLMRQVIEKAEGTPLKLGVAMPGPFDYQGGVSYIRGLNKYEKLYGLNIRQSLSDALQLDPQHIRFRNDAEAAVEGEALAGSAANCSDVIGITLGTGFGAAHFYHSNTVDLNWGSLPFRDSIADDYLSTRWFLKRYYELTGFSVIGVKELAAIAAQSVNARQVFKEFTDNLRVFLAQQLESHSPERLLICGNIALSHRYFLPILKKHLKKVRIELGRLGEDSALLGAAALFKETRHLQVVR